MAALPIEELRDLAVQFAVGGTVTVAEWAAILRGVDVSAASVRNATDRHTRYGQVDWSSFLAEASAAADGAAGGARPPRTPGAPSPAWSFRRGSGLQGGRARVVVRLEGLNVERAAKVIAAFDPEGSGVVSVTSLASALQMLGFSHDQVSCLMKESRTFDGDRVDYAQFLNFLTTDVAPSALDSRSQEMAMPALRVERGKVNAALTAHGVAEETVARAGDATAEALTAEAEACCTELRTQQAELLADARAVTREANQSGARARQQCGEAMTMVLESRKMMARVAVERRRSDAQRDAWRDEAAQAKILRAGASRERDLLRDEGALLHSMIATLRKDNATLRAAAFEAESRAAALGEQLASSAYHLASSDDQIADLIAELSRLKRGAGAGGPGAQPAAPIAVGGSLLSMAE